jgi:2-oxoglutarate ferredoxin oxidoreductase subunit beta
VLTRAANHKGSAFVEIFQNCNVFNDGAYEHLTERSVKDQMQLKLEHGKPLLYAKGTRGIRLNGFRPEAVTLGEQGVTEKDLLVHDEKAAASLPFLLSELQSPEFPTPLGVFRAVERPVHHELDQAQLVKARGGGRGDGNLKALLHQGDTWTVG